MIIYTQLYTFLLQQPRLPSFLLSCKFFHTGKKEVACCDNNYNSLCLTYSEYIFWNLISFGVLGVVGKSPSASSYIGLWFLEGALPSMPFTEKLDERSRRFCNIISRMRTIIARMARITKIASTPPTEPATTAWLLSMILSVAVVGGLVGVSGEPTKLGGPIKCYA